MMKGTFLSKPAQLSLRIENTAYDIDTANVSINMSLIHVVRNQYVSTKKEHYTIPCTWNMTKEIVKSFEFLVGAHTFTRGLCKLVVVVRGINDDVYLYKKEVTYGVILSPLKVRLLPRL